MWNLPNSVEKKFWGRILESWKQSGLTQSAFCQNEGLAESHFNFWKIVLMKSPSWGSESQAPDQDSTSTDPAIAAAKSSIQPNVPAPMKRRPRRRRKGSAQAPASTCAAGEKTRSVYAEKSDETTLQGNLHRGRTASGDNGNGQERKERQTIPAMAIKSSSRRTKRPRSTHEEPLTTMPRGDRWDLLVTNKESQHFQKTFPFDFSHMQDGPIKTLAKQYVWRNYKENRREVSGLRGFHYAFNHFVAFASAHGIVTLRNLTNSHVDLFLSYLKTVPVCEETSPEEPEETASPRYLKRTSQRQSLAALKAIIAWGQIRAPEKVPAQNIFTGNEFPRIHQRIRIEVLDEEEKAELEYAIAEDADVYVGTILTIIRDTGARPGDVMGLRINCLKSHPVTGDSTITWWEHKKRRWHGPIPVPPAVVRAVKEIGRFTEPLRDMADPAIRDYLFLVGTIDTENRISVAKLDEQEFQSRLKRFVDSNDLARSDGQPLRGLPGMLRRTLATDMLSDDKHPEVVRQLLGHSSFITTGRYYASYKDRAHAAAFNGFVVGNITEIDERIISDDRELEWFRKNTVIKARMEDGYCTRPYQGTGDTCAHLIKRKNCYGCSRFVTTPEYLPFFRSFLQDMQVDVESHAHLGDHYTKHLTPTMEIVEHIIAQLDDRRDGFDPAGTQRLHPTTQEPEKEHLR